MKTPKRTESMQSAPPKGTKSVQSVFPRGIKSIQNTSPYSNSKSQQFLYSEKILTKSSEKKWERFNRKIKV